jgi:hypothetical protein
MNWRLCNILLSSRSYTLPKSTSFANSDTGQDTGVMTTELKIKEKNQYNSEGQIHFFLTKLRVQYGNESLDKDYDKVGMRKLKLSINTFTSFDFYRRSSYYYCTVILKKSNENKQ